MLQLHIALSARLAMRGLNRRRESSCMARSMRAALPHCPASPPAGKRTHARMRAPTVLSDSSTTGTPLHVPVFWLPTSALCSALCAAAQLPVLTVGVRLFQAAAMCCLNGFQPACVNPLTVQVDLEDFSPLASALAP